MSDIDISVSTEYDSGLKRVIADVGELGDKAVGQAKGAWSSYKSAVNEVNDKFNTVRATGQQALGILEAGWNAVVVPAMESQQVMAQTENVIRSTGGAAGLTAAEVERLAGSTSRLSGVDDEAVQSGENLLLTFTGIGQDIFPRTTRAMVDMAVALNHGSTVGLDLSSTAIQLGKALNNPAEGLTALKRVGVSFNDEQEKTIKEMVRVGDVAGAQAVILQELEKEFGGAGQAAGETLPGQLSKAEVAIGNLGEEIGEHFLPMVGEAATTLNTLVGGSSQLEAAFITSQQAMMTELLAGRMTLDDYNAGILGMTTSIAQWDAGLAQNLLTQAQMNALEFEGAQITATMAGAINSTVQAVQEKAAATAQANVEDALAADRIQFAGQTMETAAEQTKRLNDEMTALGTLMRGEVSQEFASYNQQQAELRDRAAEIATELDKLQATQGLATTQQRDGALTAAELNLANLKLAESQTKLSEATDPLKQAELAVKIEDLQGKITGASTAVTSYVDNSKRIEELKEKYDGINAKIGENAAKHEDATKRILFGYAQQQLAADGLSGVEVEALNKLAGQFGLIDKKSEQAFANVLKATQGLAEDGSIVRFQTNMELALEGVTGKTVTANTEVENTRQGLEEVGIVVSTNTAPAINALTTQVELARDPLANLKNSLDESGTSAKTAAEKADDLLQKIDDLPERKDIDIYVNVHGSVPNVGGGNTKRAGGGDVTAGWPYWVGEEGPEAFIPARSGRILSRADALNAMSRSSDLGLLAKAVQDLARAPAAGGAPVVNVYVERVASEVDLDALAYRVASAIQARQ